MNQKTRIILAAVILVVIVGVILGVDAIQRQRAASRAPENMPPGSIPIYMDGKFINSFVPDDLEQLTLVSFIDDEEGKTQEGWLLEEVLLLYFKPNNLKDDTQISVISTSRELSKTLSWEQVVTKENMIMFDLSGRGTLKCISKIPGFDIRDTWIQDVDLIEITSP